MQIQVACQVKGWHAAPSMGVSAADETALEASSRQRSPDSLKHLFKQPLSAVYPYLPCMSHAPVCNK